jgi:hypothetical protein
LLQTYIEHLRGNIEDKQEVNHHGKTVRVEAVAAAPAISSTLRLEVISPLVLNGPSYLSRNTPGRTSPPGREKAGCTTTRSSLQWTSLCRGRPSKPFTKSEPITYIYLAYFFPRKEAHVDARKLERAMSVAYWGVPVLATLFVLTYWTLGLLHSAGPDIEAMMEQAGRQPIN